MILPFEKLIVAAFLTVMVSQSLGQEREIIVSLDLFPPFINQDKSGLTIDLFQEIERNSDLRFIYDFDHYDKVKLKLFQGKADVIGHVANTYDPMGIGKIGQYIDLKIDVVDFKLYSG